MINRETQNSTHPTVMVVDDRDEARLLLSNWLANHGYRVVEADCCDQAVDLAEREHPALILMDIKMPGSEGDGLSATRRIRESADLRGVPIVIVSADGTQYYKDAAIAAGADEYLTKPIELEELRELLSRFLPNAKQAGAMH